MICITKKSNESKGGMGESRSSHIVIRIRSYFLCTLSLFSLCYKRFLAEVHAELTRKLLVYIWPFQQTVRKECLSTVITNWLKSDWTEQGHVTLAELIIDPEAQTPWVTRPRSQAHSLIEELPAPATHEFLAEKAVSTYKMVKCFPQKKDD